MIIFKVGYNKNSFTSALGKWYGSIISVETMNSQTDKLVKKGEVQSCTPPLLQALCILQCFLFQRFHILVDTLHLLWYVDALRALR